jgi:hypothetical protein
MKAIYVITLSLGLMANCYAQDAASFYDSPYKARNSGSFGKKSFLVSAGVGAPNLRYGYTGKGSFSPAIYIELEHGFLRDEIGLGASMVTSWGSRNQGSEKIREIAFFVSGYYHFNKLISVKKLDIYAGLGLAYRRYFYANEANPYDIITGNILLPTHVGVRYSLTPKLSLHVRYTYDRRSNVNGGVTFRLK